MARRVSSIVLLYSFLVLAEAGSPAPEPKQESEIPAAKSSDTVSSIPFASSDEQPARTLPGRILHFPSDRSLGMVRVQEVLPRKIESFHYWIDISDFYTKARYIGQAQGEVPVPEGQRVGLVITQAAGHDLSDLAKLKSDDLYLLILNENAEDRCMPYIANLTGLRILQMGRSQITNKGLKYLENLKSLEYLTVPERMSDPAMKYLEGLSSLKGLYFRTTRITSKGLRHLTKLPSLEELDISGDSIDAGGLVYLTKLPSLNYLILSGRCCTDEAMSHIRNIPSLKILNVMHQPITDEGLRRLSGHPGLENLGLFNTEITNRGLVYLESLPSLKKLDIGTRNYQNPPVTDEGMIHIAKLKGLEYLDLPNVGITDKGLAYITELKNLKHLWVCGQSNSPLTDKALEQVAKLPSLEYLLIHGTGFTDAGMEYLSKLITLKDLNLGGDTISNAGLAKLKTLELLEKFNLKSKNITISGLSALNALKNITDLDVLDVKQDNSGLDIAGLSKLEKLGLTLQVKRQEGKIVHDELRDEDLACLAKHTNLKWLQIGFISKNQITDAGMACLAGLTNMERLTIGSPYLTDKSLACLKEMKGLEDMTIAGNFTDGGLQNLEGLQNLGRLVIYSDHDFSPAAVKRLKRSLPNLNTFTIEPDRELGAATENNAPKPAEGAVAPAFCVKTLDGKALKLSDFHGKVVLLHFWATWCRPCVAATPGLKKYYAEMKEWLGENFEMIGLSMDESDGQLRKHIDKHALTWPQARIGLKSKISADYGVNDRAPVDFLIGPDGRFLLTPESPDDADVKTMIQEALKTYSSQSQKQGKVQSPNPIQSTAPESPVEKPAAGDPNKEAG